MTAKRKPKVVLPDDAFYGWHELLHTSWIITTLIGREILGHQCIKDRPEWEGLAERAHQAMFDLYQSVGHYHLADTGDEARSTQPMDVSIRVPTK